MQGMFDVSLSVWDKTRFTTATAVSYFQGRSFDFVGVVCTCFWLGFWHLGFCFFVVGVWALGFGRLGAWAFGYWVFGLQRLGFNVWASVFALQHLG